MKGGDALVQRLVMTELKYSICMTIMVALFLVIST